MLAILVVIPFIISGLIALVTRNDRVAGPAAFIAGIASMILVAYLYIYNPGIQTLGWFSVGSYAISLVTSLSEIHLAFLALIAFMSTMVLLYSLGFMDVPSERAGFYAEMSFFVAGMMLFAIGADLITLFIGWELIGLASYLLIGFWRQRQSAVNAANKAVVILLIGDVLVFAAIVLLWSQLHSLSVSYIISNASGLTATIAAMLIVIGALTKSAQFPFNEWLTGAMEGPTPVSTLLHSSTMVKAGVFLIAILLPFIIGAGVGPLLIGAGLVTVVVASVNALSSTHIKKILAYSTMADMGLMFIALGFNSIIAAMMLFLFQTFYKGLIFMDAGMLTKANNDETDIRKMATGRRISIILPLVIAVASIAGIFPLGGFFGKVAVESTVNNYVLYAVLLLAELLSSMYIFRWLFVPLQNSKPAAKAAAKGKKKQEYIAPTPMSMAVWILSISVVLSSAIILIPGAPKLSIALESGLIYTAIIAFGLVLAYLFYYRRLASAPKIRSMFSRMADIGYWINVFYNGLVAGLRSIGAAMETFDHELFAAVKGSGYGLGRISMAMEKTENGSINYYLAAFVIGLIAAVVVFSVI